MSSNNESINVTECTDLNKFNSTTEQCALLLSVLSECSENSWIDYTYLFYCQIGCQSLVLPLIVSSFILFILFVALGITADDFLCPSLLAISKSLKLNQGIVGVTFLAFGNGAPDIITSFSGISQSRPGLVISGLFGAGVFVTTIVFGSILISSDFKLTERPLIRDVIFYLASCFFAWAIVYQQVIHLWQVILFLFIYLGYIVSVILGRFFYERFTVRKTAQSTEAIVNSNDTTPSTTPPCTYKKFNNHLDASNSVDENNLSPQFATRLSNNLDTTVPSISVTVSPDTNVFNIDQSHDTISSHVQSNEITSSSDFYNTASLRNNSIFESFRSSRSRSSSFSPKNNNKNTLDADSESHFKRNRSNTSSIHSKRSLRGHHENTLFTLTHSDEFIASDEKCSHQQCLRSPISSGFVESTESSTMQGDAITCMTNEDDNQIKYLESLTWWGDFLVHIQPFDGNEFYSASVMQKIMTIIRSPFYIILTLTVPVVDGENHLSNWCRLLNAFHCISGPLVLLLAGGFFFHSIYGIPLALIVTLIGCIIAVIVMLTSQFRRPPFYHCLFAYLGFVVSVCWTYTFASEVVSLLKAIGIVLDVSDAILGLTVLALGNSLGDFVSNLSMARQGFPRIGVSACFGGPLMSKYIEQTKHILLYTVQCNIEK